MEKSKNKRQHFVPQHYLRHFCESGQIGVAATDPFRYLGADTTRNQCQASYFYCQDDDDSLDEWLSAVESTSAEVLRRISETRKMTDEELVGLRMLAVIFYLRTRKAADVAKLMPKWKADIILKDAIDRGELPPPPGGWRPGLMDFTGASGMLLRHSLIPCWMEMQTVWQKFLVPGPDTVKQFLTSDHPVVTLNPFLDQNDGDRSFSGFSRSGFQLFFPLSPTCCVMFYDAGVYKVGGKRETTVPLSAYDMDQVNGLQIQAADRILLFHPNTQKEEVSQIYSSFERYRRPLEDHLRPVETHNDKSEELVIIKNSIVSLPKPFDFCRTVRHPRIGESGRRNGTWTQFSEIVREEFEKSPRGTGRTGGQCA